MKRWAARCLLALAMILTAIPAAAETMEMAAKNRIMANLPAGLKADCRIQDGRMDIVVDMDGTDWDKVATVASKSGSIVIHPGIQMPAGMQGAQSFTEFFRWQNLTQAENDQRVADQIANWGNGNNAQDVYCDQGLVIGNYDPGTGVFYPREIPEIAGQGLAVRWKGDNGASRTERVLVTVRYSDIQVRYVRRSMQAEKLIVPNAGGYEQAPSTHVRSQQTDHGKIVYRLDNGAVGETIYTLAAAPARLGANDSWKAYLHREGRKEPLNLVSHSVSGSQGICAVIPKQIGGADRLDKHDWVIEWVDEKGTSRAVFCLEAVFQTGSPKQMVQYKDDCAPIPPSSVKWEVVDALDGLDVSYDAANGSFHLSIDEARLPANGKADLSQTFVRIGVYPPQGARTCRLSRIQGDVIYGNVGEADSFVGELNVAEGQPVTPPELTQYFFTKLTAKQANGKLLSYFVAPAVYGEYGGTTLIFEWKDAQGNRIGSRQYLTMTTDAYKAASRVNPSLTAAPRNAVTAPVAQAASGNYYLDSVLIPQECENGLCYDLQLQDADRNPVKPDEPVLVYLPYPAGRSAEEWGMEDFTVYHRLHDGSTETFSLSNQKLELTPYGLCMQVTSFSPYFMSWTDTRPAQADAAALPQTGDDAQPAAWLLLLAVSAAAMGLLKLKRCK